ncbi:MAG: hypothetical protein JWO00_411 [Candidatus Parcubacteria bacterium]|nr:hypothetical protein [Candidatus Parcubacteria bacterium]
MKDRALLIVVSILLGLAVIFCTTSLSRDPAQSADQSQNPLEAPHSTQATDTPAVQHALSSTPLRQIAQRDKLIALLDPKDRESIFKVVDAIQNDPAIVDDCHEMAHDIGRQAYEYYGFSDAMTFDNPNHVKHALVQNICAGGYMHGVEEALSAHEPGFLEKPELVCDQVPAADRASCFHGMGHVFMLANDRDADAAILGCRVIEWASDRYRCFEGVRMEQFWGGAASLSSPVLGWDPKAPLSTCESAREDERPTCFLYSTFGYLRVHPKDYTGAAALCAKSGLNDSDDHFCLKGLGMTMMSKFKGQSMENSEMYATDLSLAEKYSFYEGVLGYAHLSGLSNAQLGDVCGLLKGDSLVCLDALSLNEAAEAAQ